MKRKSSTAVSSGKLYSDPDYWTEERMKSAKPANMTVDHWTRGGGIPTKPAIAMPKPGPGKSTTKGNKGGAVRGKARAAQVKARNAARKAATNKKGTASVAVPKSGSTVGVGGSRPKSRAGRDYELMKRRR